MIATTYNNNNSDGASLYNIGTTPSRLDSNTVTFRDGPNQWAVDMSNTIDSTRSLTVHDDVSLDNFFARPILISTSTFTPGVTFAGTTFDPWTLYITNTRVANRMSNYRLFSGKLNLKFMINGNSFYYGRYMASYQPMATYDVGYIGASIGSTSSLMQDSSG